MHKNYTWVKSENESVVLNATKEIVCTIKKTPLFVENGSLQKWRVTYKRYSNEEEFISREDAEAYVDSLSCFS